METYEKDQMDTPGGSMGPGGGGGGGGGGVTQRVAHLLSILHVVVHQNASGIAGVIPDIRQEDAPAPHSQDVHTTLGSTQHLTHMGCSVEPSLQLIHRNHVGAANVHRCSIHAETHGAQGARVSLPGGTTSPTMHVHTCLQVVCVVLTECACPYHLSHQRLRWPERMLGPCRCP